MYKDGRRETLNPDGRAHAAVVWDYYQQGCSVRLLNPQTYSRSVWKLNSTLQQFFNSCVGANIYLTPSGSQGFAPHYDDIEAFVLQLEGRKHWKLYKPRSEGEVLPRYSSSNFNEDEIGSPVLDVVLEPGDMLYFPRGFIHQAKSVPDLHSLHITVSACQKNTWGDLLEKLAPAALKLALEEDVEFRKALPRDYLEYVGITYSDKKSSKRSEFMHHVEYLMSKLFSFAPVDAAVDQMVGDFLHSSLPPFLTKAQSSCTIHGSGPRWMSSGVLSASPLLTKDVKICLLQQGIARLV
jgi:lysine-specific demethylase/histidyl-hydroxylase NO66